MSAPNENDRYNEPTRHDPLGSAPTNPGGSTGSMSGGTTQQAEPDSLEERIKRRLADHDESASAVDKNDPIIGMTINNRFLVTSKIGAGGMGAVYRARQVGMQRDVAIKVLLRELTENETVLRRFHLEALAVSKLKHPNTIQIFDFGETEEGLLYIAMELLEGRPLQKVVADERQLAVKRALHILEQTAKSLREAHTKGIVHRDLKPDNIFLQVVGEDSDYVKVLDFGVAKVAEGDGQNKTLTKAGSIFGTPKYMSPEQSRGGEIDARSDIYALGIILYELLTGRVPFNAENPLGILIKHLQEVPPPFGLVRPDLVIPEQVERFVLKLLAKSVDDRPQTTEAIIREIEKLQAEIPPLFRTVVTREDAEAAGIEISTLSLTALDTSLTMGGEGSGRTQTVHVEPHIQRRRRWITVGLGTVVVLVASAGGLYAALPRLAPAYMSFTDLKAAESQLVPEFDVQSVYVNVVSEPLGADVVNEAGAIVGQTPYILRRLKGAPGERYAFRKEGYHEYKRSFDFDRDSSATFSLEKLRVEPEIIVPAITPDRTPGDRPVTRLVTTTTTNPVIKPDKIPDTRPNPYGGPKKIDDTKANPYGGGGAKPPGGSAPKNPYQ